MSELDLVFVPTNKQETKIAKQWEQHFTHKRRAFFPANSTVDTVPQALEYLRILSKMSSRYAASIKGSFWTNTQMQIMEYAKYKHRTSIQYCLNFPVYFQLHENKNAIIKLFWNALSIQEKQEKYREGTAPPWATGNSLQHLFN